MKNVLLNFTVHNHQPIGNFDSVIEQAYERSYRPCLDVLERHPSVKSTQPLDRLPPRVAGGHHPEFATRPRGVTERGQLGILTGAELDRIQDVTPLRHEEVDFDCDAPLEVIVESTLLDPHFKPYLGGSLLELDLKPKGGGVPPAAPGEGKPRDEENIHDGVLVKQGRLGALSDLRLVPEGRLP